MRWTARLPRLSGTRRKDVLVDIDAVLVFLLLIVVAVGISLPLGRRTSLARLVLAMAVLSAVATLAFVGLESYFAA